MAKRYTADEKMATVLASLCERRSHRELCRRHGVTTSLLYQWRKRFLEGGKPHPAKFN